MRKNNKRNARRAPQRRTRRNQLRKQFTMPKTPSNTWVQTLIDPFNHTSHYGGGSWRPAAVHKVRHRATLTADANGYAFLLIPPGSCSSGGSGSYYADSTGGTITAVGVVTAVAAGALPVPNIGTNVELRLSALGYRIRYLGTKLNEAGTVSAIDVNAIDLPSITKQLDMETFVSDPTVSTRTLVREQPVQGYLIPNSQQGSARWQNYTEMNEYDEDVDFPKKEGWPIRLLFFRGMTSGESVEVDIIQVIETAIGVRLNGSEQILSRTLGRHVSRQPCPTAGLLPQIIPSFNRTPHHHVREVADKLRRIGSGIVSAGRFAWQHRNEIHNAMSMLGDIGNPAAQLSIEL